MPVIIGAVKSALRDQRRQMPDYPGRTTAPVENVGSPEILVILNQADQPFRRFLPVDIVTLIIQLKCFVHQVIRRESNIRILLSEGMVLFAVFPSKPDKTKIVSDLEETHPAKDSGT